MPPISTRDGASAVLSRDLATALDGTRVLLFGASGQLGRAIRAIGALAAARVELVTPSSREADLLRPERIRAAMLAARPEVVINAAAYTRVDDAEGAPEQAEAINATAPGVMAGVARELGARFVHVSTDYVFDGEGGAPYHVGATTSPGSVYGATKRRGEVAVLAAHPGAAVVRTAWVHSGAAGNFIATAVRVLTSGSTMRVVDDQLGTPTRSAHLAEAILRIVVRPEVTGMMHFTDAGVASWFDVATCVLTTLQGRGAVGEQVAVVPVASTEHPRPAKRPRAAVLDKHDSWRRIDWIPPHWEVGVRASTHEILDASQCASS